MRTRREARVVAEGVETDAELDQVIDLGVDYLQGYRIARPAETAPPGERGGAARDCTRQWTERGNSMHWNADLYDGKHRFVSDYGSQMLGKLCLKPGMRVLASRLRDGNSNKAHRRSRGGRRA